MLVTEPGKAPRRVPARLIGRVVIVGNVPMESAVVTLFVQQGTPVIFFDRRDLRPAITLLCEERGPQRRSRQHLLFRRPPTSERIRLWLRSKRRLSVVRVLKRLSRRLAKRFEREGLREEDYDALLRTLRRSNPRWQVLVGVLRGMMLSSLFRCCNGRGLIPTAGSSIRRRILDWALTSASSWNLRSIFRPFASSRTPREGAISPGSLKGRRCRR